MATPGWNYQGTHADINALMLFPWPANMCFDIVSGQLGIMSGLTWRQYLSVIGAFWEHTYRYPHHSLRINNERVTVKEQSYNAQLFGLCVRALLERGYLDMAGNLHPPVPFADPPNDYRDLPLGWTPSTVG